MNDLASWLSGDLTTAGRIWSALAPALVLGSYAILGLLAYLVRHALYGRYRDAEMEARGTTAFLGAHPRAWFAWIMRPIWGVFLKARIPPNAVTTLSLLLALAAGVAVAAGRFALGGWLYLFAGALDFVDGRIARVSGQATPAGAVLDSTLDRYVESALLVGLAWYYRESWVLLVVLATLTGSFLVPYVRARGEGLGVDVKVGVMQRPERLVLLGFSVAFSPILAAVWRPEDPRPPHSLAILALLVLAVTTHLTALYRLAWVMRAVSPDESRAPVLGTGRGSMLRNVVAAVLATATDFGAVVLIVAALGAPAWLATAAGCFVGGVVNFGINRVWTFGSRGAPVAEASRYTLVSVTSALLNAGGVAVLLLLPNLDYRLAWAIARLAVFVAWNYPLHRDYVFVGKRIGEAGLRAA